MAIETYAVTVSFGETFLFRADFSQASSGIQTNFDPDGSDDSWRGTQWQVADARHSPDEAARILVRDCGSDWYAAPSDDRDLEEILDEVMAGSHVRCIGEAQEA